MSRKTIGAIIAIIIFLCIAVIAAYDPIQQQINSWLPSRTASSTLGIGSISDNRADYSGEQIPAFSKLEITFQISNTVAQNFQLPYDPNLPEGLDPADPQHNGIRVDALFLPPGEGQWKNAYRQPAFYYQYFEDEVKQSWDGNNHEWFLPTNEFAWKVRFSPHEPGTWQYRLEAQDAAASSQSDPQSFVVIPSSSKGFIHTSQTDPRYFEFDNGAPFHPIGFNSSAALEDPILNNESRYQRLSQNGINLLRVWISNMYGTAWLEWLGGRNIYDGYLPRAGAEPVYDPQTDQNSLAMVIDYETEGDTGWYDACRFQFWNNPEAVKPNTPYRLQIKYWGQNISGPRVASSSEFGVVGKIGGDWEVNCYEPDTSTVITNYGKNTPAWDSIEGVWNSGNNHFLPRIYIGMENVRAGKAYIQSISLREDLGGGQYGPEIINEPSLEYELYYPEHTAYALDKLVALAERSGIYLKLVIMEKNDSIFTKLDDDGSFVLGGESDNSDGFYGLGRTINKTRWLQQAWWRYLQARWGYSATIHSWEATNEGDPWTTQHYELTDEMGKFMHCEVFGVEVSPGDAQKCTYSHPNRHMVTTSFWHSFPAEQLWKNANYPNIDYADVHAYISTSAIGITSAELEKMQWDAAYYHLGHSQALGGWAIGKPIVRGEAGIDSVDQQVEQPGLTQDQHGVWLHNFLWSTLDPGALIELYWWGDNLQTQPGPDGQTGLYEIFVHFSNFIANIPLNNGFYQSAEALATNPDLRVVGQKDTHNQRAHLWIQNKKHTWKNVIDGVNNITGVAGEVTLSGFTPNASIPVEWHVFTTDGVPTISTSTVAARSDGAVTLTLPGDNHVTDVGIKIGEYPTP